MTDGKIGNIDLVKQLNSAAVYRQIDKHGPISRIQVAEASQLAPASVTKITRQLLERGLIKEVAHQASTGGRRAISLTTSTQNFHTIAIRLGRDDIEIGLYDLSGSYLLGERQSFLYQDQAQLAHGLVDHIQRFLDTNIKNINELIAIGLVMPGLINPNTGIVEYMPNIQVSDWPLAQELQAAFDISVFIGNDIRGLALAEHYFGATQDCQDSIVVSIYRGTGSGIIVDGNVFLGHKQNVGELGHIQVDSLGKRCQCGNYGCLETIATEPAMIAYIEEQIQNGYPTSLHDEHEINMKVICQHAQDGDPLARNMLVYVGEQIGKVLAMTVNLLNPQKIVIAGDIILAKEIVFDAIHRSLAHQALHAFAKDLSLTESQLYTQPSIAAFALIKRAMLNGELLLKLLNETHETNINL